MYQVHLRTKNMTIHPKYLQQPLAVLDEIGGGLRCQADSVRRLSLSLTTYAKLDSHARWQIS